MTDLGHLFVRIRGRLVHMPTAVLADDSAARAAARARFFRERDAAGYRQAMANPRHDTPGLALFAAAARRRVRRNRHAQEPR